MSKKKLVKPAEQKPIQAEKANLISRHPLFSTLIAALVLLLVFYHQVMLGGMTFQAPDKLTANAAVPFMKDALNRGIYPLWCPYIFGGMPSYGSLITAPRVNLIDSTVLAVFNAVNGIIPLNQFTILFLNYLLFAGLMYALLRSQKIAPLAATFAAIAVIFMPQFVAFTAFGHSTKFLSLVLIPLIFLLAAKLLEKRNALYFSLTALVVGLQMMRAHVQVSYYTFLMLGLYFLFQLTAEWRETKQAKPMLLGGALMAGAILAGVLLSSVLYVSVLDYQRFSIRGGGAGGGLNFDYASNWSFHPLEMVTFFIPAFMGFGGQTYWGKMPFTDYPLYFSVLVLLLAGVAFVLRRNKMTWFFGLLALFSLLVSFGKHVPILYMPMYKFLPYFNKFRVPSMIHILLDIAMVVLAAYGLQALLDFHVQGTKLRDRELMQKSLKRYLNIFVAFIAIITLFVLLSRSGFLSLVASARAQLNFAQRELAYNKAMLDSLKTLAITSVSVVLIFQYLRNKVSRTVLASSLITLLLVDLWMVDFKVIHPQPPSDEKAFFAETPDVRTIKQDKGLYRIFPVLTEKSGNWFMHHLIQNILGYHPAKLRIYQEFLEETGFDPQGQAFILKYWRYVMRDGEPAYQPVPVQQIPAQRLSFDSAMLDMLNVKYLIANGLPIYDSRFREVHHQEPWVYENTTVLPRAFFADSVETLIGRRSIFARMKDGKFDPRHTAIIEEQAPFAVLPADSNTATVSAYDIHKITIDARVIRPTVMVLSEVYYPSGWKAYVDGVETKIYKTNYILRSIFLKPGAHKIEFRFAPTSFALGMWISIVTLLLLLSLLITTLYVRMKDRKAQQGLTPAVEMAKSV